MMFRAVIATAVVINLPMTAHAAWTETVLHNFASSGPNAVKGYHPLWGVTRDSSGTLYGTTHSGGSGGGGVVFKLTATGSFAILRAFAQSGSGFVNGYHPFSGLVQDSRGNLYGTTLYGGSGRGGVVFKIAPSGSFSLLHSFSNSAGSDKGYYPYFGRLLLDSTGALYGTTYYGGAAGGGAVYKLAPTAAGPWSFKMLHSFAAPGDVVADGYGPVGELIFDDGGALYGTTHFGGTGKGGVVYKLTPTSSGPWTETILHSFVNTGSAMAYGFYPAATLILDKSNHSLYGTTACGGSGKGGVVYKLTPRSAPPWPATVLRSFADACSGVAPSTRDGLNSATDQIQPPDVDSRASALTGGCDPGNGSLVLRSGALYGVTTSCGAGAGGVVYKLNPTSASPWPQTVLHSFSSSGQGTTKGFAPSGTIALDGNGNLFGAASYGGAAAGGVVYKLSP